MQLRVGLEHRIEVCPNCSPLNRSPLRTETWPSPGMVKFQSPAEQMHPPVPPARRFQVPEQILLGMQAQGRGPRSYRAPPLLPQCGFDPEATRGTASRPQRDHHLENAAKEERPLKKKFVLSDKEKQETTKNNSPHAAPHKHPMHILPRMLTTGARPNGTSGAATARSSRDIGRNTQPAVTRASHCKPST